MANHEYRNDITGLRGIAIILVLLFHYQIPFFSNGYVGVDIFFVISGYVITLGATSRIENGKFNTYAFYFSRCKRLIPALLLMILCTYLLSAFLYFPESFKSIGQFVVSSVLFSTNFLLYMKDSNYFGLENGENPLFHTWSLGVEWQFYLLFPFLINFLFTTQHKFFFSILIFAASFIMAILHSENQSAVFYLPIYRLWEIMAGVVLCLHERKSDSRYSTSLGLLLIILSIIIDVDNDYLDLNVIVAIIGTLLVIKGDPMTVLCTKILQNYVINFIGLISYSLYLWHIPVYFMVGVLFAEEMRLTLTFLILVPLATLSYKFVEAKSGLVVTKTLHFLPLVLSALFLASFGFLGHLNGGFPKRSQLFENLAANNGFGLMCSDNSKNMPYCRSARSPQLAVLGNSYAMVYVKPLVEADYPILQLTKDSCALGYVDVVHDANSKYTCADFYRDAVKTINSDPNIKVVLLSSTFEKEMQNEYFKNSLQELLIDLENKHIIVLGPTPRSPFNVGNCLLKSKLLGLVDDCSFGLKESHVELITKINLELAKQPDVKFWDIAPLVCLGNRCKMRLGAVNAMYIDTGHLSFSGASTILRSMEINGFTIPVEKM